LNTKDINYPWWEKAFPKAVSPSMQKVLIMLTASRIFWFPTVRLALAALNKVSTSIIALSFADLDASLAVVYVRLF
jgi:hypothetical protein